jgi:hypothetical protein
MEGENVASEPTRRNVTFEELSCSNMLTLNAPIEVLEKKGLPDKQEVLRTGEAVDRGDEANPAVALSPQQPFTGVAKPSERDVSLPSRV